MLTGVNQFARAMQLAAQKHVDQKDLAGLPYMGHICAVVAGVAHRGEEAMTVAALHDIVEDTDITIRDLTELFPQYVVDNVDVLTKRPEERDNYVAYIARIRQSGSRVAVWVKEADIKHNMDVCRLLNTPVEVPEWKMRQLHWQRRKYAAALDYLLGGERYALIAVLEEPHNG